MLKASSMILYTLCMDSSHISCKQTAHRNKSARITTFPFLFWLSSWPLHRRWLSNQIRNKAAPSYFLNLRHNLQVINSCLFDANRKKQIPFSSQVFLLSSGSTCTSWRIRGLRVTMPVPRGRRSLPTKLSSTELFPLLCKSDEPQKTNKSVLTKSIWTSLHLVKKRNVLSN